MGLKHWVPPKCDQLFHSGQSKCVFFFPVFFFTHWPIAIREILAYIVPFSRPRGCVRAGGARGWASTGHLAAHGGDVAGRSSEAPGRAGGAQDVEPMPAPGGAAGWMMEIKCGPFCWKQLRNMVKYGETWWNMMSTSGNLWWTMMYCDIKLR